jgi:hypothetical protein
MALSVGMVEYLDLIVRLLANSRGSTDEFVLLLQRPLKNAAALRDCCSWLVCRATQWWGDYLCKVAMSLYVFEDMHAAYAT